jgi:hypothetical protein
VFLSLEVTGERNGNVGMKKTRANRSGGPKTESYGTAAQDPAKISLVELKGLMTPPQMRIFEKHAKRISKLENSEMIEVCLAMHMLGYDKDAVVERILFLVGANREEASVADK